LSGGLGERNTWISRSSAGVVSRPADEREA